MSAFENNAEAFADAIRKMAKEKCKSINDETEFIKNQRTEAFEKDAQARCKSNIKYETARIRSDKNKSVSLAKEEAKKELSSLRNELTQKVFSAAKEQIKSFTDSDKYLEYLVKSVEEIYKDASESTVYYLSEKDLKHADDIKKALKNDSLTFEKSREIVLGGVKAHDKESGCLYDNSLDVKFDEQKEWFIENSGLKI